jgi:hypothetical protein
MNKMLCVGALTLPLLVACKRPEPPPTEQRPEPQASALRQTIQQPLDKAKAAQQAVDDAAAAQRAAIDAASR